MKYPRHLVPFQPAIIFLPSPLSFFIPLPFLLTPLPSFLFPLLPSLLLSSHLIAHHAPCHPGCLGGPSYYRLQGPSAPASPRLHESSASYPVHSKARRWKALDVHRWLLPPICRCGWRWGKGTLGGYRGHPGQDAPLRMRHLHGWAQAGKDRASSACPYPIWH